MGGLPILRAAGLQTAHNPFSGVTAGGLYTAKNVSIFSNGVIEPRRGHKQLSYTYSSPNTSLSNAGAFFGDTLILHHDDGSLSYDTGSAFTTFSGTYTPVDNSLLRMKFAESRGRYYINTADGTTSQAEATDTPDEAGIPEALDFDFANTKTSGTPNASGAWFPVNSQVAYRVVFGRRDAEGNERIGAPSGRAVIINPPDVSVAIGGLVRSGGAVTATVSSHEYVFSGTVAVTCADANYASGNYSATLFTATTIRYTDGAGTGVASTAVATISSGTKVTSIRFEVPDDITTDYFYRVYRTVTSGSSTTDPGDEMYLQSEAQVTSANITDQSISITDSTPDGALGSPLYTNTRSGDGILQANNRPVVGKDLAHWSDRLWIANTISRHRLTLELLGTGSPDGMQSGDSITINGVAFTANTSFTLYTTYVASRNIEFTARALCAAVNFDSSVGVYARYVSTDGDTPGKILLEERTIGGDAFSVYASRVASWSPTLTTTSSGATTSSNDAKPHGIYYSKFQESEAFPLLNYLFVGSKGGQILRILPLREKLYVFKEDGVFTVAGEEPFRVDCLDEKLRLVSPDTAVVLNNQIFAFTNQGVVAVSDAGVQILSRAIENQLLPYLSAAQRSTIKRHAFAVAHETDRSYELWLPGGGTSSSSVSNKAFVYSPITQAWTIWSGSERSWGAVSPTDVRYYGSTAGKVLKERRDYASSDYADEYLSVTVNTYAGTTLTLASTSGIEVGDGLLHSKSGTEQRSIITAVGASTITIDSNVLTALQTGSTVTVEKGIDCDVRWLPQAYDRPASLKNFQYGTLHFGAPSAFTLGKAAYESNHSTSTETETVDFRTLGWGEAAWGSSAWGSPARNLNFAHLIPLEKQQATMLYGGFKIREAYAGWKLHGFTLDTEEANSQGSR